MISSPKQSRRAAQLHQPGQPVFRLPVHRPQHTDLSKKNFIFAFFKLTGLYNSIKYNVIFHSIEYCTERVNVTH